MQDKTSKEEALVDSKYARTPTSPAKAFGSIVPWHGRSASPASSLPTDQEEACSASKRVTSQPQRPQAGARKWSISMIDHIGLSNTPIKSSENFPENVTVSSFGLSNQKSPSSEGKFLTSTFPIDYPDFLRNGMKKSNITAETSRVSLSATSSVARLLESSIVPEDVQNVQKLLTHGFDVSGDVAEMQRPPLILAVLTGNDALVKQLLLTGADINCIDSENSTALHHAAAMGNRSLVKLLLVAGADVNVMTKKGLLPVHLAVDSSIQQLLSQRMKSVTQSHSGVGFPHECPCTSILELNSQDQHISDMEHPQNNQSLRIKAPYNFDNSIGESKNNLPHFQCGSVGQLNLKDESMNQFPEDLRSNQQSSSNMSSPKQNLGLIAASRVEKDVNSNKCLSCVNQSEDKVGREKQVVKPENMQSQRLSPDKGTHQVLSKDRNQNGLGYKRADLEDLTKESTEESFQRSSKFLSSNHASDWLDEKLKDQYVVQRTDNKNLFEPMLTTISMTPQLSLNTPKSPLLEDKETYITDSALSKASQEDEGLSDGHTVGREEQTMKKGDISGKSNDVLKNAGQITAQTLNHDVCVDSDIKTSGTKFQETPRMENISKLPSVEADAFVMEKEEKRVKFQVPSETDLALVRKDWHNAAIAGCVGCGTEDCGGKCLPKIVHMRINEEKASNAQSNSKTRNSFKKGQTKKTKNFEWKKGELLGEGAYGKVFCGLNQSTGELMAVKQLKFLNITEDSEKSIYMSCLEREISMYKEMRHKHIVGYIDMDKDEEAGHLYIFLEYVSGGSIQGMLEKYGPFSEPLVRVYTRQLLLGLEYLHKNRIVHRDIKGGNVLVSSDGTVKLADFGASKAFHEATMTDGCKSIRGSIFWMAPEVIKGDNYGRHTDVWSVGCTVIEMLTATHPWSGIDNSWAAIFQIAKASSGPPIPESISESAKNFLVSCFHMDPKMRPSASELLKHPFVA